MLATSFAPLAGGGFADAASVHMLACSLLGARVAALDAVDRLVGVAADRLLVAVSAVTAIACGSAATKNASLQSWRLKRTTTARCGDEGRRPRKAR